MIVILYQDRCRDVAEKTALELVGAFAAGDDRTDRRRLRRWLARRDFMG